MDSGKYSGKRVAGKDRKKSIPAISGKYFSVLKRENWIAGKTEFPVSSTCNHYSGKREGFSPKGEGESFPLSLPHPHGVRP